MKARKLIIPLVLLMAVVLTIQGFTPQVWATIVADSSCAGHATSGTTITCSLVHGANVYVIVGMNGYNPPGTTSVTVGGTSLSSMHAAYSTNDAGLKLYSGFVVASGTDTVTWTLSNTMGSAPNVLTGIEAIAFTGVDSGTPFSDLTAAGDGGQSSSPRTLTVTVAPASPITGQMYVVVPAPFTYRDSSAMARTGASAGQTVDASEATYNDGGIQNQRMGIAIGYDQDNGASLVLSQTWTHTESGTYHLEWNIVGFILHPATVTSTTSHTNTLTSVIVTSTTKNEVFNSTTTTGTSTNITNTITGILSFTTVTTLHTTTSTTTTRTTSFGTGVVTITIYVLNDVPTLLYSLALILILLPTMFLLVKSRTVAAMLMGFNTGLVWATSTGLLPIQALLALVAVVVIAIMFRARGSGGQV